MGEKLDVCDKSILLWGKTSARSSFEIGKTKWSVSDEELQLDMTGVNTPKQYTFSLRWINTKSIRSLLQSVFRQLLTFILLIYPRASSDTLLGFLSSSAKLLMRQEIKDRLLNVSGTFFNWRLSVAQWRKVGVSYHQTIPSADFAWPTTSPSFALALKRPIHVSKRFVWYCSGVCVLELGGEGYSVSSKQPKAMCRYV